MNTPIDAWEDLHERFAKADRIRIVSLKSALHNLKQGNRSVLDYYTDMRALWEELNSHRPMPNCTCVHQCRCDAMCAARNYRVVQEESNFALSNPVTSNADESNVLVNASDTRKHNNRGKSPMANGKGKGDTRHCTFCDKSGHTVDWCYKKHGNPNIRSNSNVNSVNSDGGDASPTANGSTELVGSSSSTGISQEKYDQLVTLLQQVNLIPSSTSGLGSSSNHIHTTPTVESGHISPSTHLSLVHSVVSCSIQSNSQFWLIDSGANDHICSSLDWFSSYYRIKPIHVNLPNGNSVIVKYAGNVHFSSHLYLSNVSLCFLS
jgi:hypothetical protein